LDIIDTRVDLGFTAMVTTLTPFSNVPNAHGEHVFTDISKFEPNEAYFEHVDSLLDQLEFRGIAVYLVALWWNQVNAERYAPSPPRT
jgi:hypothetical protein